MPSRIMYLIKIFSIGKHKEQWLIDALSEYEKRLTGRARIQWHLMKKESELEPALTKEKHYHCLDPQGKSYTSESFSHVITSASSHSFVIGGDTGFPESVKNKSKSLISLSPLTFTHQHTRLILLEQIYRSLEIQRGSEYHK